VTLMSYMPFHNSGKRDLQVFKDFANQIFPAIPGEASKMNFEEYSSINKKVSSEMFTFLMLTLYNVLPLTQNIQRQIK
jgi:hypothetical protein